MDVTIALAALTALLQNAAPILQVLTTANAEGRTTLTDAEWAQIKASADTAHAALESALGAFAPPPSGSTPPGSGSPSASPQPSTAGGGAPDPATGA